MSLSNIDLNLLTVFHTIYETRSISAAARQLDLSQPGMSHALKRLRTQLDDKLFVRKGNGVEPTVYADRISVPIRNALEALQIDIDLSPQFDPSVSTRSFKLALMDWSEDFILPALLKFAAVNPNLTFELVSPRTDTIEDMLLQGVVDLVFHLPPDLMHEITSETALESSLCLLHDQGHPIETSKNLLLDYLTSPKASLNLRAGAVANLGKVNVASKSAHHSVLFHSMRSAPGMVKGTGLLCAMPELYARYLAPIYDLAVTELPKDFLSQKFCLSWHRRNAYDFGHQWLRATALASLRSSQVKFCRT